ncbi:hypothetical protein KAW64_15255 [bacterium]|nr:hypothetical protein [bacterium]
MKSPVLKHLLCASVCATGLFLSAVAVAAPCPRSIEVIAHASPALVFDEELFIQTFGDAFEDAGASLTAGELEPDYVLAVTYDEFEGDEGVVYSCLSLMLGYVDGVIGDANFMSAICTVPAQYGEPVWYDGTIVRGNDLLAHGSTVVALAGELPKRLAEHEQIPVSATPIVRTKCFSGGQTGVIKLIDFQCPHACPVRGSDIKNRMVVTAERGRISNGVPLESDDKSRVFTIPSRSRKWSIVEIEYEAPGDGNGDVLTVRNSCDILSGKPLSATTPGEIMLTKELPGCGHPSLEYAHSFTVSYGEGMLDYTVTGEIPLTITRSPADADELVAGEVSGHGTLVVMMAGSFRECTVTYQSEMNCVVTGEVRLHRTVASYVRKLHLTLTESYGGVGGGAMIDCPKQEPFFTGGVWAPEIVQGEEAKLIFNDVDGDVITRPFSADAVTGDAKWVLHNP